MATKILRVFQEFTSEGYVPMPPTGNIDYGYTIAGTFPTTTPATFQTDNPDLEVTVTEVTDFYVWIRSHGTEWNYQYTRNVRVYPDSPSINNVVMGIIIANLGNTVPYTGATENVDLGEFGITQGYSKFDLTPTNTPTTAGTMSWNDGDGTLDLILKGGNVTLQLGQELVARCYNAEATTLVDGEIVYIYGSQGNRVSVKRASASSEMSSSVTFGMVTEPIASGAEGFVTISGVVNKLNTSALTAGTALWLGTTPGTYTPTKPTAPIHSVLIGYVERVHATVGSIYVKVQNGYELDELHNVKITTPTENDFLVYDDTQQVWENRAVIKANGYIPYFDSTDLFKQSPILVDGVNVTMNGMPLLLSDEGQLNYITKFGSTKTVINSLLYDTGTKVGIGTTNPEFLFTVVGGAMGVYSSSTNYGFIDTANTSMRLVSANGFNFTANNIGTIANTRVDANGNWGFGIGTPAYKVDVNGDVNTNGIYRINGSPISTSNIAEGTNLYFTSNRVLGQVLTGLNTSLTGVVTAADSLIVGISKLQNQVSSIVSGVSSVFGRTGAVTAQSGDYTTTLVTEGSNLYYTDARARNAISGGIGISYNNTTGLIAFSGTLYTDSSIRALFSAGSGISYNNTTGVITSTITQYTDAMARASISLTTTGTSGAATYNSTTGVLNIPQYQTALTNPITGTGTTNYLPKFTGSTTLGNSLIYDSGTRVIVNATSYTGLAPLSVRANSPYNIAFEAVANDANNSIYLRPNNSGYNLISSNYISASPYLPLSLSARENVSDLYLGITGNVGIGTSSPSDKLQIGGSGNLGVTIANTGNTSSDYSALRFSQASTEKAVLYTNNNNLTISSGGSLILYTSSAEKARIDTSGNLGLGVTPSAWTTSFKALQIGNRASLFTFNSSTTDIGNNTYFSTTLNDYTYLETAAASFYRQSSGQHIWFNAGSNTAGTAISFTQAMTLDASGNLMVGTTTASYPSSGRGNITIGGSSTSVLSFQNNGTGKGFLYHGGTNFELYNNANGFLGFGTNGSEQMRINAGGNVSIGNTNNTYKLDVSGTIYASGALDIRNYSSFFGSQKGYIYFAEDQINAYYSTDADATLNFNYYGYNGGLTRFRNFDVYNGKGSKIFGLLGSTGAATFSSTITATSATLKNNSSTPTYLVLDGTNRTSPTTGRNYEIGTGYAGVGNEKFYIYDNTANVSRLVINDIGNVGIGTTSPSYLLHVKGSGAYNGAIFADNTGTTAGGSFQVGVNGTAVGSISVAGTYLGNTDQNMAYYAGTSLGHIWYTNGANERMRITSSGNVGIGTTSPSYKLQTYSTNLINSFFNNDYVSGSYNYTSIAFGYAIGANQSATIGYAYNATTPTDSFIHLTPYGSAEGSKFIIKANGNVGIGTTSPSTIGSYRVLEINGTSGGILALSAGGTKYGQVSGNTSGITYEALGATGHYFYSNGSERVRITSTGTVGIGTTSPISPLTVKSQESAARGITILGRSDSISTLRFFDSAGTTEQGGLISTSTYLGFTYADSEKLRITNTGNVLFDNHYGYSGGNITISTNTSGAASINLATGAGAGTTRLYIKSSGEVGIGTTSPSVKLEVVGNILTNLSGYQLQMYPAWDTGLGGFGMSSNHGLVLVTNATERMRITSTGAVGIATNNPTGIFQVAGSGNIFFGDTPSNTNYKFNVKGFSGNYISFWTPTLSGVNQNGIMSHSGAGLGAVTPLGYYASAHIFGGEVTGGGLVQVAGDVNISGTFRVNGTAIGTGGGGVSGSGTTGYHAKWSSSTSLTNSIINESGDEVGVNGSNFPRFTFKSGATYRGMIGINTDNLFWIASAGSTELILSTNSLGRINIKGDGKILFNSSTGANLILEATGGSDSALYTTLNGNLRAVARFTQDLTNNRGVGFGYDAGDQLGFVYGTTTGSTASKLGLVIYNGSSWVNMLIAKSNTINLPSLPTSTSGLVFGDLYVDANGFVKRYNVV